VSNSPHSLSLGVLTPEVNDLSMCVSHRSMVANHFGSLGFGSFNLSTLTFSHSAYTQSRRSIDACLPQIEGCKSLRLLGLQEFQSLHTLFLPEFLHLKSMICRCVSPTDRWLQITSALRASKFSTSPHSLSPGVLTPEVDNLSTCVLSLRSMV
jgi:hypothetical protein